MDIVWLKSPDLENETVAGGGGRLIFKQVEHFVTFLYNLGQSMSITKKDIIYLLLSLSKHIY